MQQILWKFLLRLQERPQEINKAHRLRAAAEAEMGPDESGAIDFLAGNVDEPQGRRRATTLRLGRLSRVIDGRQPKTSI